MRSRLIFGLLSIFYLFPTLTFAQTASFQIKIAEVAPGYYVHTSYKQFGTQPFPSNGLLVQTKEGLILVDTAWDMDQTKQLLQWVDTTLKQKINLCIISHGHDDRVGGISELTKRKIRVISTSATAAKSVQLGFEKPEGVLPTDSTFRVGQTKIRCFYPGEGHTRDNIVVYFPQQKLLFGGCLVKSTAAVNLGNVADANMQEWATSIRKLQTTFPDVQIVIPGHQEWGDAKALEHTLQLLEKK